MERPGRDYTALSRVELRRIVTMLRTRWVCLHHQNNGSPFALTSAAQMAFARISCSISGIASRISRARSSYRSLRHVDRVAAAEPCLEARRHAAAPFSGYGFAIDASSGLSDLSSANAYLCFAGITIFWHSSCLITRSQMPALFVHQDGVTRLS